MKDSFSSKQKTDAEQSEKLIEENQKKENTMEVHHPIGSHSKKQFKDYLFEFLMLFLAVSAGFFVENIRENYIERHREKQYIESLLRDIIADTVSMQSIINTSQQQIYGIDSLMKVLENPKSEYFINNIYFYSFNYMNSAIFFNHNDGTITQLKNAGGLRLIRPAVSDSIIMYYSLVEGVKTNNEFCMVLINNVLNKEKELFDFKILRLGKYKNIRNYSDRSNVTLRTNDPQKLDDFYNEIFIVLSQLQNYNQVLVELKPRTSALIDFLKKTYELE
jgi:hypothetical protein